MLQENKGIVLRSQPENFSDGAEVQIDLDFLRILMSRMRAPIVRELIFHLRLDCTATAAGHAGEDSAKFIRRVRLRDAAGVFFDLPGSLMRIAEQMEIGSVQQDSADIAASTQDASHDVFLRAIFDTEKAHRGADTGVPLSHFLTNGEIAVRFAKPATIDTVASGQLRVYAVVHDERTREAKARMVWKETSVTKTEDSYKVLGSLRAAFLSSDLGTAAGYTSLAGLTEIDSKVLQYFDLDSEIVRQEYRRVSRDRASDDEFLASTPNALPLLSPSKGQHVGKLPDLNSFDLKVASVPASGRMVLCLIEDRSVDLAAEWLGFATPADYMQALLKDGEVVIEGGADRRVLAWDRKLVRRLPVRIPRAS